jgi:NAD+ kinase
MVSSGRVVLCPKDSEIFWIASEHHVPVERVPGILRAQGRSENDIREMYESYGRQVASLERAHKLLESAGFDPVIVYSGELHVGAQPALDAIRSSPVVISVGGDNHFLFIAEHAMGVPILGLNSDPQTSKGALLWGSVEELATSFQSFVHAVEHGFADHQLSHWPLIDLWVDDRPIRSAVSEIFIGKERRRSMSRYRIDGVEVGSSGLLIANGAGSTGWFQSSRGEEDVTFDPALRELRYIHTEHYAGYAHRVEPGVIRPNEELVVESLMDKGGEVSPDGLYGIPVRYGTKVRIALSQESLKVVSL